MPTHTLSGTLYSPVTLAAGNPLYASPLTITGAIVYGTAALTLESPWTVTVTGAISSGYPDGFGIDALAASRIDNAGGIYGYGAGVWLQGGFVTNAAAGSISGHGYGVHGIGATVLNAGTISGYADAIWLQGGSLANQADAVVRAASGFGVLETGATLSNDGLIRARAFAAIFANGGSIDNGAHGTLSSGLEGIFGYSGDSLAITNQGYILGGEKGIDAGPAMVSNASGGVIIGGQTGVYFSQPSTLVNAGTLLTEDGGQGVVLRGGTLLNTGTIIGATGIAGYGEVVNAGVIEGEANTGYGTYTLSAFSHAVIFNAPGDFTEAAAGVVLGGILGDGGTLTAEGGTLTLGGFAEVVFAAGATAALSAYLGSFGTIAGFAAGDRLTLLDQTADAGTVVGNRLTLSENGALVGTLAFAGDPGGEVLAVTPDGEGDTDITIPCLCAGTRIATPRGELAIEHLAPGDWVTTLHGGARQIAWIGRRHYAGAFIARHEQVWPVRVKAGALGPGQPARDLRLSPGHALFVEGALIQAADLVNGVSILREGAGDVTYIHLELATHEILAAEGAWVESFIETGCRQKFHQAEGLSQPPQAPFALPLREGFVLEAIRERISQRAGIPVPAPALGPLLGFVDIAGPGLAAGWAHGGSACPVCLDVLLSGRLAGRVLANRMREDLRRAGYGTGRHGFEFTLPPGAGAPVVRRAADGAPLALTLAASALSARAAASAA